MSRTMKIRKLKLFYFQKNARYRAKELCRNIFLGNLSLNEGKISVGLPVLILEFWWRHVKTKNRWPHVIHLSSYNVWKWTPHYYFITINPISFTGLVSPRKWRTYVLTLVPKNLFIIPFVPLRIRVRAFHCPRSDREWCKAAKLARGIFLYPIQPVWPYPSVSACQA